MILRDGIIEQVGSPLELYHKPINQFVAGFIGNPNMNFLPCKCVAAGGDFTTVSIGSDMVVQLPIPSADVSVGDKVTLGIRPSDLFMATGGAGLSFTPEVIERLGNETVIYGASGEDTSLRMIGDETIKIRTGVGVDISFDPQNAHLFREDGTALDRRVDLDALAELG